MEHEEPEAKPIESEEAGFHRALAENPNDSVTWKVYADWLQEHGQDLDAEIMRNHAERLESDPTSTKGVINANRNFDRRHRTLELHNSENSKNKGKSWVRLFRENKLDPDRMISVHSLMDNERFAPHLRNFLESGGNIPGNYSNWYLDVLKKRHPEHFARRRGLAKNMNRFAKVEESAIHPDFQKRGIAPRIGRALQMIAAEGKGGHTETNPSGIAEHILTTGDHFALPILADALDETNHPMKDVFDWRHARRGIAIDRALQDEMGKYRVRHWTPETNRRGMNTLSPGWVIADWREGARNTKLSQRRALEGIRKTIPDATKADLHHSLLRLYENWVDREYRSHVKTALPHEITPTNLQSDNIFLQQLGTPTTENVHTYPDARIKPKKSKKPEQKRRGTPTRLQSYQSPAGGIGVRGQFYPGGQMIPKEGTETNPAPEKSGILRQIVNKLRPKRSKVQMAKGRKPIDLSDEIISLMGKVSDAALAKKAGVSIPVIIRKRNQLGIQSFMPMSPKFQFTQEIIDKMGTMPDKQLADEYGIKTHDIISRERKRLGISAFQPKKIDSLNPLGSKPFEWKPEHLELLGKIPDQQLANQIGIHWHTVNRKRKELGIEPFGKNRTDLKAPERSTYEEFSKVEMARFAKREWTPEEIELLKSMNNLDIARKTGISRPTIIKKRKELSIPHPGTSGIKRKWTPEEISLLGTVPDLHIAGKLGIGIDTVQDERNRREIPAFMSFFEWKPEHDELLGTMTDKALGKKIGTTAESVFRRRNRLQIPAFQIGKGNPLGNPAPKREWADHEIKLIGTMPDQKLAHYLGISVITARKKRNELGIKPFGRIIGQKEELPERSTYEEFSLASHRKSDIVKKTLFAEERGRLMNTLTNQLRSAHQTPNLTPEEVWHHPEAKSIIESTHEGDQRKDYLPRMIYADWLDDHGLNEHAQSIREDAQQNPEEWDWDNGHDWDRARNMADVGLLPKGYSNKKTWPMQKNPHISESDSQELSQFPGLFISYDGHEPDENFVNMDPVGGGWVGGNAMNPLFEPYVGNEQARGGFAHDYLDVFHPHNGYETQRPEHYHEARKALSDDIAEASRKLWERNNPF